MRQNNRAYEIELNQSPIPLPSTPRSPLSLRGFLPCRLIGFIFIEQKCHSHTKGKPSQPTVFYSRLHRQFFNIRPAVNGQSSSGIDFSVCSRIFPRFSVLVLRTCGSCWCPCGGWPVLANCCSLDLQLAEPGALCIDTGHHRPEDRVPRLGRRFQNKTKSQIWSSAAPHHTGVPAFTSSSLMFSSSPAWNIDRRTENRCQWRPIYFVLKADFRV